MVSGAHVILQIALCSAALHAAPESQITVNVHAVDRTTRLTVDRTFSVERGYEPKKVEELDLQWAVYRMRVTVPKYRCAADAYVVALPDTTRTMTVNLNDGDAKTPPPTMMVAGKAPESFLYAKPTYVLLEKNAAVCDKPIAPLLPMKIEVENDPDGYYAALYPDPSMPHTATQLAMRLTTAAHQYHYVRIPLGFVTDWRGWPQTIQFNVSEGMIDELAGKPVDTLLCPKLWETSAG